MGIGASDSSGVCLNRTEIQAAASEYVAIGFIHLFVAFIQPCCILIKGVIVLHYENS